VLRTKERVLETAPLPSESIRSAARLPVAFFISTSGLAEISGCSSFGEVRDSALDPAELDDENLVVTDVAHWR
jgi:hypothetical protein